MSRALPAALLLGALASLAAPPPASPPPAAVERLARGLADDVRALAPEPPVALHLGGASAELRRALGSVLASHLAASHLAPLVLEAPTAEAAEAQARAQGARTLLRLTLAVEEGELRARGDALGTWVNFWSGRLPTRPARPAAALARAEPADAQALALAALPTPQPPPGAGTPPPPLRLLGAVLARLESPPAALAAGDLDGDGRDEVAVLTERAVLVLSSEGQMLARHALDALPPSPTPTREPFGALAVLSGPPRLAAWSSRYAQGEVLALDRARGQLRPLSPLEAVPLGPSERGAFTPGQTRFTPEVRLADGRALSAPAPFTTASFAPPLALLVHPDGTASLYPRPTSTPARLGGLGAGSALGDLDGDGVPELLTTSPLPRPSPDMLRVYALGPEGAAPQAEPLWQGALPPGRALHVVTANLDGDGRREVLVGLWHAEGTGEIFLLRQGAP